MAPDLAGRTRQMALMVIQLFGKLPKTIEAQVLGKQLLRSGTSVGAHYREGVRARSQAEFISKIEGGLQELEETQYWLELLQAAEIIAPKEVKKLYQETEELIAILVIIVKKTKAGVSKPVATFHPS